ncbi:unnamed protein product, partial [Mesorhabditis belari]|uniref:mannose-6-phosphate isomerase n=1 Tax=Mesorhabditis belari TaxID=2138241 RepID=A0AAF3J1W2_9BILA
MQKLKCKVQNYDWGKIGKESTVAQLAHNGNHTSTVQEDKPYAEFWMGVHPNGPSECSADGVPLSEMIKAPNSLGDHEEGTLQFLFKVLSVRKALSIQTHPTKEQARLLHATDPKNYPDDNHKPEMAIALTTFELLCGFRPAEEIYHHIRKYPELRRLLGEQCCHMEDLLNSIHEMQLQALQKIFTTIWSSSPETISQYVGELVKRLQNDKEKINDVEKLILRLNGDYPGDVGVLAPLLLNYFTLEPGQATFLGPNRPHAYLFGDCVECMSCSDNTIRAGLTPKFKDISTLCKNMDYTMGPPPIMEIKRESEHLVLYAPNTPEFAVQQITANQTIVLPDSSSILIVTSGSATISGDVQKISLEKGSVIFIPKHTQSFSIEGSTADFCAYQAFMPKP